MENESEDGGRHKSIALPSFYKLFLFADLKDTMLMIIGSIAAVGSGLSMPLMAVIFGQLINSFGETTRDSYVVHEVYQVVLKFVYLGIASGVASFLQVACWMATGERQAARIRNLYFKTLLRQDIAFFDKETNSGEIVGAMSGDVILIQDAMGEKVGRLIQLLSSFLGGISIAFIHGWLLTLIMIPIIPLVILTSGLMSIAIARMSIKSQIAYSEAATIVEQTIGSIRTVAAFNGENLATHKYTKSLKTAYKATVQQGLAAGIGLASAHSIIYFGYALGVWYGSKLIVNKGYSGGHVINVIFALFTGSFSLGQASPCLTAFRAGQAATSKMLLAMKRKPQIDACESTKMVDYCIAGNVEFRDVYFSYPTRPNEQILCGFSLSIPSGMTIGLVGESGCGKSTVISLIERFYDPQFGELLIDGINLKQFPVRWIRGKIGLVSQEPVLFACSIRDNISYGKDNATDEEIKAAIDIANASRFIDKLPQRLDTIIGKHEAQLSGGQKQRIALARAILKDPQILLLDEATSALDVESERVVQETLEKVIIDTTTIIVAHRLTTVRNADTIAVIQGGTIVEKGSHVELINNPCGAYYRLTHLQQMNESDRSPSDEMKPTTYKKSFVEDTSPQRTLLDMDGNNTMNQPSSREQTQSHVSIYRLASLNKPELGVLLVGIIAAMISGVLLPIFGTFLSFMVQIFYEAPDKLSHDSKHWAVMFIILGIVTMMVIPARSYFFSVAGGKLIERIRFKSFHKVVNMEVAWFDEVHNSSGSIGAKLSSDAAAVRLLVGDALALGVQNIATLIAGMLVAFIACWQLALITVVLVPLIAFNGWTQMKLIKGFSADTKVMYEEAIQIANDAIGNIRTVASFTAENRVMELYKKKCRGPTKAGVRQGVISGVGFGISLFVMFCAYAICFYAGARLIDEKKTTAIDVFRVFFALNMVAVGISQSTSLSSDTIKAKSATSSIFAILDQMSAIDPSDQSGITSLQVMGNIEFDRVYFAYPKRKQTMVFQNLCFTVQPRQTLALIGKSGCGKSTIMSLLQRFYDPDLGRILLDGYELHKYQLRWLRQQMGLVGQEPVLFNDTIRANIAYGKQDGVSEVEIIAAAKSANAHTFITSLHQGYDTMVGDRGIQLSGGQKQRIAIARAIVKHPKIFLLDEATSALDNESERVVKDALDEVMADKTILVVAHRLSTIKGADSIAVIQSGSIIQKGNHEELMKIDDGAYASLLSMHIQPCT